MAISVSINDYPIGFLQEIARHVLLPGAERTPEGSLLYSTCLDLWHKDDEGEHRQIASLNLHFLLHASGPNSIRVDFAQSAEALNPGLVTEYRDLEWTFFADHSSGWPEGLSKPIYNSVRAVTDYAEVLERDIDIQCDRDISPYFGRLVSIQWLNPNGSVYQEDALRNRSSWVAARPHIQSFIRDVGLS